MTVLDRLGVPPTRALDAPGGRVTEYDIELRMRRSDNMPRVTVIIWRGDEIIAERDLSVDELRRIGDFLTAEYKLIDPRDDLRDFAPVSQR